MRRLQLNIKGVMRTSKLPSVRQFWAAITVIATVGDWDMIDDC